MWTDQEPDKADENRRIGSTSASICDMSWLAFDAFYERGECDK